MASKKIFAIGQAGEGLRLGDEGGRGQRGERGLNTRRRGPGMAVSSRLQQRRRRPCRLSGTGSQNWPRSIRATLSATAPNGCSPPRGGRGAHGEALQAERAEKTWTDAKKG